MKFSFKIFISVILVMVLTLSAGGYYLISTLFSDALQREQSAGEKEHILIQFSLETALSTLDSPTHEEIIELAGALESGGNLALRLFDAQGGQLYGQPGTPELPQSGWLLSTITSQRQLRQDSQLGANSQQPLFLQTTKDISHVFTQRDQNYTTYLRLMLVLIGVNSILIFLLALFLTQPVRKLSKTARQIAGGDLSQRASVSSRDEIGQLAGEFNRMADHLQQQIQELEDANRRQDEFIGSFAHEIKTPLTSVIGYADLLRSRRLPPEKTMDYASYIFQEGRRMESLAFKLMDMIVLKNQPLQKEWVPVADLVGRCREFLLDRPLEVQVDPAQLLVDPDLIATLLFNLLDNARKATEQGGDIRITGRLKENQYLLCVADGGEGIPPQELDKITEAFYMVDKSRNREQGGVGLGLALCTRIAALHGIQMQLQSAPGQGTHVSLLFQEVKPCPSN